MTEKIYTCDECEADFEVIHDSSDEVNYCPFCGEVLSIFDDDEIEDEDED